MRRLARARPLFSHRVTSDVTWSVLRSSGHTSYDPLEANPTFFYHTGGGFSSDYSSTERRAVGPTATKPSITSKSTTTKQMTRLSLHDAYKLDPPAFCEKQSIEEETFRKGQLKQTFQDAIKGSFRVKSAEDEDDDHDPLSDLTRM